MTRPRRSLGASAVAIGLLGASGIGFVGLGVYQLVAALVAPVTSVATVPAPGRSPPTAPASTRAPAPQQAPTLTALPRDVPRAPPLDPARPPNVLLITLCSVREDHLGPSGYASADTPTLDLLAQEGTWFTHAWAPATFTLPSHASMFTGLLPAHAGVMTTSDTIRASVPTLPEILSLYGYHGVAYAPVASRASFSAGYGFERGFATFLEGAGTSDGPNSIDQGGLDAIAATQPYFAVIHLKEAHPPYSPPIDEPDVDPRLLEWNARRLAGPSAAPSAMGPDDWMLAQMAEDPSLAAGVARAYDDALTRVDAHLTLIFEGLARRGALDHTIVIVAGDHGQALGEGGRIGHQGLLQPEVLNVPLVVRMPVDDPGAKRGARVDGDVGLVDLLPTIAELVGATPPGTLDGRSLAPLLRGETLPERGVLAQAIALRPDHSAVATEALFHGPLWLDFPMHGVARWTLRRLVEGAWQTTDDPALAAPMLAERALLSGAQAPPGTPTVLTDAEREALRAQGYW